MKILSVNSGSSSLKVSLYEMDNQTLIINVIFERIGLDNTFYTINYNNEKTKKERLFKNHEEAIQIFLEELINLEVIKNLNEIKGIGHRVVHGADKYKISTKIDDDVIIDIETFSHLAPLHNPPNLVGIRAFKKLLPDTLSVAVFDTSFHQTMNNDAYIYPVPYEWYSKYGVRKYGFHGISHHYISERISEILNNKDLKVISCHLGNGGSITAIKNGKCIDTSLGFTPISGIMMGTRCGDIDVSIIPYMMKQTNNTIVEIMNQLNKNSGLLGVSGISNDLREIEAGIKKKNERCILAKQLYINKILMYISYYNTILGGTDVIVFTAGVGENSSLIRGEVMNQLQSLGVEIDQKNNEVRGKEAKITTDASKISCYIIPTNEELMIAKEVLRFIE
jgi:acetate kinase